jgi:hypothetical protein
MRKETTFRSHVTGILSTLLLEEKEGKERMGREKKRNESEFTEYLILSHLLQRNQKKSQRIRSSHHSSFQILILGWQLWQLSFRLLKTTLLGTVIKEEKRGEESRIHSSSIEPCHLVICYVSPITVFR